MIKYTFLLLLFFFPGFLHAQLITLSAPTTGDYVSNQSITLLPGFSTSGPFHAYISETLNVQLGSTPSHDQNYVQTRTFKIASLVDIADPSVNDVSEVIQYFDGLGRPLQTVQTKASPLGNDIVQPMVYDAFGRQTVQYLPYAEQSGNGAYKAGALNTQAQFYGASGWDQTTVKTPAPYSQTLFESSPLNRVTEQGAPGIVWQPAAGSRTTATGRTSLVSYGTNNSSTNYTVDGFAVQLWTATPIAGADYQKTLGNGGYYAAGQLNLKITKDENWTSADGKAGTVEEYTDLAGHVVLKRTFNTINGGVETLSTYYVYDDMDRLSFVLPPGANPDSGVISVTSLDLYCYQYGYDSRSRIVGKKIPGMTGWTELVYNKLDQLVFTQDPVQRAKQQRAFIKYDGLGRVIMTGIGSNSLDDRVATQNVVDNWPANWEHKDVNNFHGYSNESVPSNVQYMDVQTVNYYDDYNIPGMAVIPADPDSYRIKSMLTATKVEVLGTSNYLWTTNIYDDNKRLSNQYLDTYEGGTVYQSGNDEIYNIYNFEGAITNRFIEHENNLGGFLTLNRYEYDQVGRKLRSYQSTNNDPEVLLVENRYNEIGQLKQKSMANGLQSTSYAYNERGWLKSSNSSQFSFQLNYQDGTVPQFNGNISGQLWGAGSVLNNNFSYTYDKLNRLASGVSAGMSEIMTYDQMGNIKNLNRDGLTRNYSYTGNQLAQITGGPEPGSYQYDGNGNAILDGKNGQVVNYNNLNLPSTIPGLNLSYVYDGTGNKLEKIKGSVITDYINGVQYTGDSVDFVQTEVGIARRNGTSYSYEYNLTDHLGNVRYTFHQNPVTGQLERLQNDDYYPFGLRKSGSPISLTNKYLYNGKELQDELGQYDYGARFYDPVIGRWNVVDPLAELSYNMTPYRYCYNNPINFTDPFGLWETIAGGYTTSDPKDIERFASYLQTEAAMNTTPSFDQQASFIKDEKAGGLGKLTNGGKLLDPIKVSSYRSGGNIGYSVDKKSFSNFWYQVQGDLTPDALDPRTWHNNILGLSYAGANNPKKYNGKEDYSRAPDQIEDIPAYVHDQDFNALHAKGANSLFGDPRTQSANDKLINSEIGIASSPGVSPISRARAIIVAGGIAAANWYNLYINSPKDNTPVHP